MTHAPARRRSPVVLSAVVALVGAPAARAQVAAEFDSVRVALSGQLDVDTRVVRGPLPGRSGMLLRRATLTLDVTAPGGWTLRLHPDLSQGRAQLLDAYVLWDRDAWSVRVGRQKVAYGVEYPLSPTTLLFPEYGVVNSLMIGRQFGVQVGTEAQQGLAQLLARRVGGPEQGDGDGGVGLSDCVHGAPAGFQALCDAYRLDSGLGYAN